MSKFTKHLKEGIKCKCPKCLKGRLYPSFFDLRLHDTCPHCGLDLAKNDSADGPAVFLIFILSTLLVPLALWTDHIFTMPLWVHALLWGTIAIMLTMGSLKPLKSYIIYLQYTHRKTDWE